MGDKSGDSKELLELARRAAMVVFRLTSAGGDVTLADVDGADDALVDDELRELAPPDETDIPREEEEFELTEACVRPRAG